MTGKRQEEILKRFTERYSLRASSKDGATIYVELTFAIIHDRDATVIGALAHARDISERWAREREQRERLQQLEQKLKVVTGAEDAE
jgi:PAS domain S-box-containing protein